jgi:hypothetical protein
MDEHVGDGCSVGLRLAPRDRRVAYRLYSDDTTGRAFVHQPAIEHSEQAGLEGVSQKSERPESTLPVPP